ncbi:MAG: hypothetical protein ACT4PM_13750 [Gemmatimonadales bacterium]
MKALVLAGVAAISIGAVILFRGITYKSDEAVLRVGEFKASVEARRSVPVWVGVAAIAGGVVLVVVAAGSRRKQ